MAFQARVIALRVTGQEIRKRVSTLGKTIEKLHKVGRGMKMVGVSYSCKSIDIVGKM
jgi:hypothetical protein